MLKTNDNVKLKETYQKAITKTKSALQTTPLLLFIVIRTITTTTTTTPVTIEQNNTYYIVATKKHLAYIINIYESFNDVFNKWVINLDSADLYDVQSGI